MADAPVDLTVALSTSVLTGSPLNMPSHPVVDPPRELKDIVQKLQLESDPRILGGLLNHLIDVAKALPSVRHIVPVKTVLTNLRRIAADGERNVRAQAFRAIRYILVDRDCVKEFFSLNIDVFVARALERDEKYVWERMQALKLVRCIMHIDPSLMTRTILQALVSVAETPKDDFRRLCLDCIRELVIVNPALVASCNGIRLIVSAILDSECQDIASSLTLTLLYLMDSHHTRKYMRPHIEIQKLFAVFLDTSSPNTRPKEVKRAAAHKALVTIMRSWTGILSLCSDPGGLRSLINLLSLPPSVKGASWSKEATFDLLFEILHVVQSQDLRWASERNAFERMGPNLLHSYIAMVLFAFMECGLVQVLTQLAMSVDSEFSSVAQNLLTEVLRLSSELFPKSLCLQLNLLPHVVRDASSFQADLARSFRASKLLTEMRHLSLAVHESLYHTGNNVNSASANSAPQPSTTVNPSHNAASVGPSEAKDLFSKEASAALSNLKKTSHSRSKKLKNHIEQRKQNVRRLSIVHGVNVEQWAFNPEAAWSYEHYFNTQEVYQPAQTSATSGPSGRYTDRFLDELRYASGTSISDEDLNALLKKSMVLQTKEYKEWDWEVVSDLLSGSLLSAHGLAVAMSTKFIKRLLSFLRPEKKMFSELNWNLENQKYVRVASQLIRLLASSKEGAENTFFVQLIDELMTGLLKEIGKGPNKPEDTSGALPLRPFSRENITNKLCREYFTLFGILSSTEYGLPFFDKHSLYENLYKLYEEESRDYLIRMLVANLDYGNSKQTRTLLETWVKNGSVNLRKYTISHMRILLRRNVNEFWQWGISLLVGQLQWSDVDVALAALSVLEEACQVDPQCLATIIKKKPSFKLVGDRANNLQNIFLSNSAGVELQRKCGYIDQQLRCWAQNEGLQRYVEALENALVDTLESVGLGYTRTALTSSTAVVSHNPSTAAPVSPPTSARKEAHGPTVFSAPNPATLLSPIPENRLGVDSETDESAKLYNGPGYVGAFGGYGGFRGIHAACRSPADDFYFDRVHQLPWNVEITLENPQGRAVSLVVDTFVHTVPQPGDVEDGLVTFVVGCVLDMEGKPHPYRIDPNHNIRARLRVGAEGNDLPKKKNNSEQVCTPEQRQVIAPDDPLPLIQSNMVHWCFTHSDLKPGSGPVSRPAAISDAHQRMAPRFRQPSRDVSGPSLYLDSVWFQLHTPSTSMPTVTLAPHLYGELAKTEEGCTILRSGEHIDDFVRVVSSIGDGSSVSSSTSSSSSALSPVTAVASGPFRGSLIGSQLLEAKAKEKEKLPKEYAPLEQRAALWALGHIGSTAIGFELLSETNIVELISHQAMTCPTLSMRGTCFYILGLLSRSDPGRAKLSSLGWQFSPQAEAGVIVPVDFCAFMRVPDTPYVGSWAVDEKNKYGVDYVPLKDNGPGEMTATNGASLGKIILGHITNLCNTVTQKTSLNALRSLRNNYKELFASPVLFAEAMKLLGAYSFRREARRCILFELFSQVRFSQEGLQVFDQPQDQSNEKALSALNDLRL